MAKNSIYLVSTDSDFLEAFYDDIKKARARGVIDLKLLVEDKALEDGKFMKLLKKYKELCEIKSRDQVFGSSIIIDEGEDAFIVLSQRFFERLSYFGIVTDHIAFGPASLFYFSYLYDSANEAKL